MDLEKMHATSADGWCDWVHPLPGYLMGCCDCGLVHEVQFSIVNNEGVETDFNPGESEASVIVFRMKRKDPEALRDAP